MKKPPRKKRKVKVSEDARVTPASPDAATGDGGRVLGNPGAALLEVMLGVHLQLHAEDPELHAELDRIEGKLARLEVLQRRIRSFRGRHAEPEPVAASGGARFAPRLRASPEHGGSGAEGTQGGPPGGAAMLWYWRGRLAGVLRAEANRRELEAFHELRAELRADRLSQLLPETPKVRLTRGPAK